jgi:hypothetical protein
MQEEEAGGVVVLGYDVLAGGDLAVEQVVHDVLDCVDVVHQRPEHEVLAQAFYYERHVVLCVLPLDLLESFVDRHVLGLNLYSHVLSGAPPLPLLWLLWFAALQFQIL